MSKHDIADYDNSNYDYRTYWNDRIYENEIEHKTLASLLPLSGDSILDIGGSFGRLMDVYAPRFNRAVIYDYSHHALEQAQKTARENGFLSVETKQGDAYTLPFEDNAFDVIMMVRVLHHIENPEELFSEVRRVLKPNGLFIIDIPNKIHLKNRFSHLINGDASFYKNQEPWHIENTKTNDQAGIFINYHPTYIISMLEKKGFKIEEKVSIHNARLPLLKKLFSPTFLVNLDTFLQPFFTPDYLGPHVWVKGNVSSKQ